MLSGPQAQFGMTGNIQLHHTSSSRHCGCESLANKLLEVINPHGMVHQQETQHGGRN